MPIAERDAKLNQLHNLCEIILNTAIGGGGGGGGRGGERENMKIMKAKDEMVDLLEEFGWTYETSDHWFSGRKKYDDSSRWWKYEYVLLAPYADKSKFISLSLSFCLTLFLIVLSLSLSIYLSIY
jgi:hypothetical protein